MPPKSKENKPGKKTQEKAKAKVVEDKTFGLKNKKGNKQQKFIDQVQKQVQNDPRKKSEDDARRKKEKEEKENAKLELNALFKPVEQKISKGADPKSILCAFFKQGNCGKGAKCKFSHDLNVARKGEKRNMFDEEGKKADEMDTWDEAQLEEVVNKKHGEKNKALPATSIICKFFLEAVENSKYGWFWECPGGEKCHYKHALPPGFVLKKDLKKKDEDTEEITLEELVEKERASLNSQNLTKVTLQTFLKWKDKKRQEKMKKIKADKDKRKKDMKSGNTSGISGRELFEFNPDLMLDDDDEADDTIYNSSVDIEKDGNDQFRELTLESLASIAGINEAKCTVAVEKVQPICNGISDGEELRINEAACLDPETTCNGATSIIDNIDIDIDEDLFDGDDIDLVEDELENLELNG